MFKFDYAEEYVLENDLIKLSPLKLVHVDALETISNEPNLWTYFLEKGNGRNNLRQYIKATLTNRKQNNEYPFIVFDKIKNQYVGTTRFYEYSSELKTIK